MTIQYQKNLNKPSFKPPETLKNSQKTLLQIPLTTILNRTGHLRRRDLSHGVTRVWEPLSQSRPPSWPFFLSALARFGRHFPKIFRKTKSLESKQFSLYLLFSDLFFFVLLIFGGPLKNNPTKIWWAYPPLIINRKNWKISTKNPLKTR
jgi:hypothetical protein